MCRFSLQTKQKKEKRTLHFSFVSFTRLCRWLSNATIYREKNKLEFICSWRTFVAYGMNTLFYFVRFLKALCKMCQNIHEIIRSGALAFTRGLYLSITNELNGKRRSNHLRAQYFVDFYSFTYIYVVACFVWLLARVSFFRQWKNAYFRGKIHLALRIWSRRITVLLKLHMQMAKRKETKKSKNN